jgi:hypothetical protein
MAQSSKNDTEDWDLWYPKAAATGLPFAQGRVAAGVQTMLVHAAPPVLSVAVRDKRGLVLAEGVDLEASDDTPIARLRRRGKRIERTDIWPTDADLEQLVILAGGEVGTLKAWWHADDKGAWRWQIELYNQR